ncbi:MAG: hypothetical protein OEM84_14625 [Acidimicrobiia bacterium]|nr:hypothetical protein [Acidimicrobiia bacterium]
MVVVLFSSCGEPADTVTGVVIDVVGDLTSVTRFTLHTSEGTDLILIPDPAGGFDFPVVHLRAHISSLEPVRVTFRETDDGTLIATAISDA